jgi:hypothetical protein
MLSIIKIKRLGGHMKKLYRDNATPKKKFYHFNIVGFKFRLKTYKRDVIKKFNIYSDNQGLGLNFNRANFKLYRS